jgi:tellurite resistance protein TerA
VSVFFVFWEVVVGVSLVKGQNVSLSKSDPSLRRVLIGLGWDARVGGGVEFDLDASVFLLGSSGRVRGLGDFVFYNQLRSGCGSVEHSGDSRSGVGVGDDELIRVNLGGVPVDVVRIVVAVSIHDADVRRQSFGQVGGAFIRLVNEDSGVELVRFDLGAVDSGESAMVFGELYRYGGEWKFRAVGQGFVGGLGALVGQFGVGLDAVGVRSVGGGVGLGKVELSKGNSSVSLVKRGGGGFGEVRVNLDWKRGGGGLFRRGAVDLDLGAFVELVSGEKFVIQALGDSFGDFDRKPFVRLLGDDRSGDSVDGEWLVLNGGRWSEVRRVLVYAFIYDGVPNWRSTDGVVRVLVPGEGEVVVRLNEFGDSRGTCAVAVLENVGGALVVRRLVSFFVSQREMDVEFGWGFSWRSGRK